MSAKLRGRIGATLSKTYRGTPLVAKVDADGLLVYAGATFQSPSVAGAAARAHVQGLSPSAKPPATNGWSFWSYTAPDGSVATLEELRSRLDEGDGPKLRVLRGGA